MLNKIIAVSLALLSLSAFGIFLNQAGSISPVGIGMLFGAIVLIVIIFRFNIRFEIRLKVDSNPKSESKPTDLNFLIGKKIKSEIEEVLQIPKEHEKSAAKQDLAIETQNHVSKDVSIIKVTKDSENSLEKKITPENSDLV